MADDTNPFPSLEDDLEPIVLGETEVVEDAELPTPLGTCWEFDFDAGDLRLAGGGAAVLLSGEETLRQWCQHVLNTVRGESPIFSDTAGTGLDSLLGGNLNDNFLIGRIGKEIADGLAQHDRVLSVTVEDVIPVGHEVFAFITVLTDEESQIQDLFKLGG